MSGFAWIGARRAWARAGHVLGLSAGFALPALATTIERVTSPSGIEAWLVREPLVAMEFAFHGGILPHMTTARHETSQVPMRSFCT